jgi:predicted amino acid dehydrogenase
LKYSKFVVSTGFLISDEIIKSLEKRSIFLDAAVPFWSGKAVKSERKDITVIESAWAARGQVKQNEFNSIFPRDKIFSCMAEAIMLGLEKKVKRSCKKIVISNVKLLKKIGEKYNFYSKVS